MGRNDPCPCGSGLRFQALLPRHGALSMGPGAMIIGATR
ncbi:MAG: SEC-C metal-binding domain-containing protein [Pseudomonadota bacterium]